MRTSLFTTILLMLMVASPSFAAQPFEIGTSAPSTVVYSIRNKDSNESPLMEIGVNTQCVIQASLVSGETVRVTPRPNASTPASDHTGSATTLNSSGEASITPDTLFLSAKFSAGNSNGSGVDITCTAGAGAGTATYVFDELPNSGALALVDDCDTSACTAGGGSIVVPKFYNGSAWQNVDSSGTVSGLTTPATELLDMNSFAITGLPTPTGDTNPATKLYVDEYEGLRFSASDYLTLNPGSTTAGIQQALDAACPGSGIREALGPVVIPAGKHPITVGIVTPTDCRRLQINGQGTLSEIIYPSGITALTVTTVSGGNRATFRDFSFIQTGSAAGGRAIFLESPSQVFMENLNISSTVLATGKGIDATGPLGVRIENTELYGFDTCVHFRSNGSYGANAVSFVDGTASQCATTAIDIDDGDGDISISRNRLESNGQGISCHGSGAIASVTENYFENVAGATEAVLQPTAGCGMNIKNNLFSTNPGLSYPAYVDIRIQSSSAGRVTIEGYRKAYGIAVENVRNPTFLFPINKGSTTDGQIDGVDMADLNSIFEDNGQLVFQSAEVAGGFDASFNYRGRHIFEDMLQMPLITDAGAACVEPGQLAVLDTTYQPHICNASNTWVAPAGGGSSFTDLAGLNAILTDATLFDGAHTTDTQLSQEQVEDFVDGVIVGGTNVTATYDDGAGTLTIASTGSGATSSGGGITQTTNATDDFCLGWDGLGTAFSDYAFCFDVSTGQMISNVNVAGSNILSMFDNGATAVNPPAAGSAAMSVLNGAYNLIDEGDTDWFPVTRTVFQGTATMGTSAIAANTCEAATTVVAANVLATDAIAFTPNADITGVTGYGPDSTGGLYIMPYPTAGNVNFRVCNPTDSSKTPGSAVVLNVLVTR